MVDLFRENTPKARKAHKCDLCGQNIERGQRYVRWEYIMDGDFRSDAYHTKCAEVICIYLEDLGDDEFFPSEVHAWAKEDGMEVGP
jgi:hypothetical protein